MKKISPCVPSWPVKGGLCHVAFAGGRFLKSSEANQGAPGEESG